MDTLHLDSFAIQTKIIDAEGHVLDRGVEGQEFQVGSYQTRSFVFLDIALDALL